jgi:hypothetical protein
LADLLARVKDRLLDIADTDTTYAFSLDEEPADSATEEAPAI